MSDILPQRFRQSLARQCGRTALLLTIAGCVCLPAYAADGGTQSDGVSPPPPPSWRVVTVVKQSQTQGKPPSGLNGSRQAPKTSSPPLLHMDAKTSEFITKWGEVYQNAKSLQYTELISYTPPQSSRVPKRVKIRFWARRPNLMRIEVETDDPKESALMVSDGRTIWEYSQASNEYLKHRVPEGSLFIQGKLGALPYVPYPLMFHPDPVKALQRGLISASMGGQEMVDGERCTVIARRFAKNLHLVWCSVRDYIPRRAINYALQEGAATALYKEERRDIRLDTTIPDEQFRFTLPRDAKLYTESNPEEALLKAGNASPEFVAEDKDGHTVRLSALQDRPVVLCFWASWSDPCETEMAALQKIAASKATPDLAVVALNIWDNQNELRERSARYPALTLWRDGEENQPRSTAYRRFGVRGVPTTYLFDNHGKVVKAWIGYDTKMVDELRSLLDMLPAK